MEACLQLAACGCACGWNPSIHPCGCAQVDADVLAGLVVHANQLRPVMGVAERKAVNAAVGALRRLKTAARIQATQARVRGR